MDHDLRIVAIIAAHNEEDIIRQTVADLVAQGIGVYLLDHCSSDGTVAAVEEFLNRGLLQVEPFPGPDSPDPEGRQFSLASIVAKKEQLARTLQADWFINADADEFRESPWSHLSLRQGIELVDHLGYNAIDFQVLNFWPTHDQFRPQDDIRTVFEHYEFGGPWDRVQIRCWKGSTVDLSAAGHDASFPGRRVFPIRFLLRHYPVRSQAHGTRKVFRERRPRFAREERERGWHVQYDRMEEGHCFIRDPSTLRQYSPEEVRVHLQVHNRDLEASQEQAAEVRRQFEAVSEQINEMRRALESSREEAAELARQSRAQLDEMGRRLRTRDEEAAALRSQGEHDRGLIEELGRSLASERLRSAQFDKQSQDLIRQRDEGLDRAAQLEARLKDLDNRLSAVLASWSWRITAPLRAALKSVTRR